MEDQVFSVLSQIIRPQYIQFYGDWIQTATESEIKGIEIINFIVKTRGQRKADNTIKSKEVHVRELLGEQFE